MKDIVLDNYFKRSIYGFGWVTVVLLGGWLWWIFTYQSYKEEVNKPSKKWILNKSYQKWVYIYGIIWLVVVTLFVIVNIFYFLIK